jgi:uncharacterized protein (DUF1684 family)
VSDEGAGHEPHEAHRAEAEAWWRARDARLRDPDGWLTLIGLHWLAPGENRFGSAPDNDIVLPGDGTPPNAGSLRLEGGEVRLRRASDEGPAVESRMAPDVSGEPTILELGSVRLHVIQRGARFGVRVRDHRAPALGRFTGMEHFPFDPGWRIRGRLAPAEPGERLEIVDVTGTVSDEETPGAFVFSRDGREWRIRALPADEGQLWLIFGDATNGAETYGGGRFLYTEAVEADGSVVADFNVAYNPPCVFSPYATCPLPPAENRLALRIEAGERAFHG